jgi:hypothetical protein
MRVAAPTFTVTEVAASMAVRACRLPPLGVTVIVVGTAAPSTTAMTPRMMKATGFGRTLAGRSTFGPRLVSAVVPASPGRPGTPPGAARAAGAATMVTARAVVSSLRIGSPFSAGQGTERPSSLLPLRQPAREAVGP